MWEDGLWEGEWRCVLWEKEGVLWDGVIWEGEMRQGVMWKSEMMMECVMRESVNWEGGKGGDGMRKGDVEEDGRG